MAARMGIASVPSSGDRGEGLVEDGFEDAAGFGLGGGELGFEPVAEGQQLVDLGEDAVLFGEGWRGMRSVSTPPTRRC
jgi:hypothetical protein